MKATRPPRTRHPKSPARYWSAALPARPPNPASGGPPVDADGEHPEQRPQHHDDADDDHDRVVEQLVDRAGAGVLWKRVEPASEPSSKTTNETRRPSVVAGSVDAWSATGTTAP